MGKTFDGTTWLNNQPDGLVYAGKVAYQYKGTMPANTSITLLDGTKGIADLAFNDCKTLVNITIPNSVTKIGGMAFAGCISLKSVTIPNSVTYIEGGAFDGTTWLNNQPDGLVYAGKVAYQYKGTMPANTSITLLNGTKGIAGGAFSFCKNLTSVTIPNSVTNIGYGVFEKTSLKSIVIPNSVTSIGEEAFRNCDSLTSVTIPNSVTSIGSGAFWGCISLTSVTIPDSVTSIERGTFYACISLTSVNIPNSVTSIGREAFVGCTLTSLTIPNSVTRIGDGAFAMCTRLTSVTIPNSVTSIGIGVFHGCTSLTSVRFERAGTTLISPSFYPSLIIDEASLFIDEANSTSLKTAYTAGGIGTYTRPSTSSSTWMKISG